MRRLTAAMAGVCLALAPVIGAVAWPGPASAQSNAPTEPPDGEEPAPEVVPGEEVCTVTDQRLLELSGLVTLEDGYAVLNDGTEFADRQGVFILDGGCQVVDQIAYPSQPRDPEDLALDREANVLWIGDIGDNFETSGGEPRPTIALWRVDLGGDRTPVIHRFTYPDGNPRDAEALLLTGDGTPIIVTKQIGSAELFVPSELRPSNGPDESVPLEAVGEFSPQDTDADHELGEAAEQVVTGGANAPDNSKVVLRTYTDAYEFEVTDGDVAGAVSNGQPNVTPLRDEPLGEAISYTADGTRYLTISEMPPDAEVSPVLLSYSPAAPPAPADDGGGEAAPAAGDGGGSLFDEVQDFINLIAAVGVIGVLLVAAGIFGIVRARRRGGRSGKGGGGGPGGPPNGGPATGRARLSGLPGEHPPGWESDQPSGVYTSQTARGPEYGGYAAEGPEYGGGEYRGTEYGAGGAGGGGYDGGGGEYGYGADPYRGGGYQEQQPYDQEHEWSNGHREREQPPAGTAYQGQTYQAGGQGQGYQGQPYPDQGYQEQGYPEQGYPGQGTPGPGHPGHHGPPPDQGYPAAPPEGGGAYSGGTYQSAPAGDAGYRDDYSDDPDYRYEFRQQPGRW